MQGVIGPQSFATPQVLQFLNQDQLRQFLIYYEILTSWPLVIQITTKILQGVPPLLKRCTYPLPENNNWNFQGVPPLSSFYPLVWHNSLVIPITWSLFSLFFSSFCQRIATGWGGLKSPSPYFSSPIFEKFRVFSPKQI